jgi:hypothetical protein
MTTVDTNLKRRTRSGSEAEGSTDEDEGVKIFESMKEVAEL